MDTCTFPVLIYDPRKGDKIAQRLSRQDDPSEKTDFFIEPKTNESYDFIRCARTEGRFSKHFDKDGNPSETRPESRAFGLLRRTRHEKVNVMKSSCPAPTFKAAILILALASPSMGSAILAATFQPAPQEFRQEVPLRWAMPPGGADSGLTLIDLTPEGEVRVADGSRWYALKEGRLQVLPPPTGLATDRGYVWMGNAARELPVPLSTIRQVHRQGDVMWLATAKGVRRLGPTGPANTELPDQDVRQVATAADGLVLAATARRALAT